MLAAAGSERLGLEDQIGCRLEDLVPAPGQGALAIEARGGGDFASIHDHPSACCLIAERHFAAAVGASCSTAVGALARVAGDTSRPDALVELTAWVGLPDGSEWISDTLTGPFASVGGLLAERMMSVGAGELLERASAVAEG